MKRPLRVAIVIDHKATLQAAGIIRGDVAEGARLLGAIRDPLERFLAAARRHVLQTRKVASREPGGDQAAITADAPTPDAIEADLRSRPWRD